MERTTTLSFFLCAASITAFGQWEPVLLDENVWGLASKGDTLLVGTYDGHLLFSPNQGTTWSDRTGNMPNGYVENIGIGAGGTLVCTNGGDVWISDDWNTWSLVRSMNGSATCLVVRGTTILAGAEFSGGLSASFDLGDTWSLISAGEPNQYSTSVAISGDTILWSRFSGPVLRTQDAGMNWTAVPELGNSVFSLSEAGGFAGSNVSIFRHAGSAWTEQIMNIQILDFDLNDDFVVACGAGQDSWQIVLSTDEGSTWLPVLTFYTEFQINKVELVGDYLYAGNSDGLYRLKINDWLSVREERIAEPLGLFPNPADRSLNIHAEQLLGLMSITIFDELGRTVQERANFVGGASMLDVSALPAGGYSLVLRYADHIATGKFLLSR